MGDRVSGGVPITRERVIEKVRAQFGPAERDAVLALLDDSGPETTPRIQMAILKLADGSVDGVRMQAAQARLDWRDVLAGAEYPRQIGIDVSTWETLPRSERERIRDADRDEYLAWLGEAAREAAR